MPHGHNTKFWIKLYICVYANKKLHVCTSPIYIYPIYPLFHCHCQCLLRSLALFYGCLVVIPNVEQEAQVALAKTVDKPKFVS